MFSRGGRGLAVMVSVAAVCALAASGCGSVAASPQPKPTRTIVARDNANGTTVSVRVGDSVRVILGSSYWKVGGSSAPSVLRQDGHAVLLPRPRNCPELPGLGCTPIRVVFTAVARGTAVIKASRSSCGEALRCVGRSTRYKLTVVVTS
jgi:hypothetical protein